MDSPFKHEDDKEKAKARLMASFENLLSHSDLEHLEVNTNILKRGQKEVLIECRCCHRFIVDMEEKEGGAQ